MYIHAPPPSVSWKKYHAVAYSYVSHILLLSFGPFESHNQVIPWVVSIGIWLRIRGQEESSPSDQTNRGRILSVIIHDARFSFLGDTPMFKLNQD